MRVVLEPLGSLSCQTLAGVLITTDACLGLHRYGFGLSVKTSHREGLGAACVAPGCSRLQFILQELVASAGVPAKEGHDRKRRRVQAK